MEQGRIGGQIASMAVWEATPATEQVEIVTKAAKRAAYQASVYGVRLTCDELIGATWLGTVDRLDADRLNKANEKQATEGKQPLTIMQVAHRAAHAAAKLDRYDYNKHRAEPLEDWTDTGDSGIEDGVITRLAIGDCIAQQDDRGKAIAELTIQGFTERQTGQAVGISGAAVHKRLVRMRKELTEAIA